MLQSDPDELVTLCETNKTANNICDDKNFWIDKFDAYNFYLPILDTDDKNAYFMEFDFIYNNMITTDIIMKINDIEKNRTFNNTNGIIRIVIENIDPYNLDKLLNGKFERDDNIWYYNEMILTPKNNKYHVQLQKINDQPLDVGFRSLYETKRIVSYCLGINGICTDEFYNSFLSMDEQIFEEPDISFGYNNQYQLIIVSVRRGLWEGMLKL